ncbi:hypothetical protein AB1N83_010208 [Pleurotus pulmonarius]
MTSCLSPFNDAHIRTLDGISLLVPISYGQLVVIVSRRVYHQARCGSPRIKDDGEDSAPCGVEPTRRASKNEINFIALPTFLHLIPIPRYPNASLPWPLVDFTISLGDPASRPFIRTRTTPPIRYPCLHRLKPLLRPSAFPL